MAKYCLFSLNDQGQQPTKLQCSTKLSAARKKLRHYVDKVGGNYALCKGTKMCSYAEQIEGRGRYDTKKRKRRGLNGAASKRRKGKRR